MEKLRHQLFAGDHDPYDYWGWCQLEPWEVNRDMSLKWGLSPHIYPEKYFPPYCQGAGFSLSWKFISCAFTNNHTANFRFLPFEDASVGMLAERCGIKPTMIEDKNWMRMYRTTSKEEQNLVLTLIE